MAEVFHRYLGKNGKIPKLTAEQKEREASDARLQAAKAREREAIAALREAELDLKRGKLVETAEVAREAQDVNIVIRSRLHLHLVLALAHAFARQLVRPFRASSSVPKA
jgi:hypothetical protein